MVLARTISRVQAGHQHTNNISVPGVDCRGYGANSAEYLEDRQLRASRGFPLGGAGGVEPQRLAERANAAEQPAARVFRRAGWIGGAAAVVGAVVGCLAEHP